MVRGVDLCVMRQALGAEEEGAKRKPRVGGTLSFHALGGHHLQPEKSREPGGQRTLRLLQLPLALATA